MSLPSFGEWRSRSMYLELKPRCDLASLFVDCPPSIMSEALNAKEEEGGHLESCGDVDGRPHDESVEKPTCGNGKPPCKPQTAADIVACVKNGTGMEGLEVVRVLEHAVQLGAPPPLRDILEPRRPASVASRRGSDASSQHSSGSSSSSKKAKKSASKSPPATPSKTAPVDWDDKDVAHGNVVGGRGARFAAKIRGLSLTPATLCAPTWADNNRLFMCKVHAESDRLPFVQKTFHRLARDLCQMERLEEFAVKGNPQLICTRCSLPLLSTEYKMTIGCLPDDEWLSTSQSAEFFCRESCGAACDPDKHNHGRKVVDSETSGKVSDEWLPNNSRLMLSFASVVALKESVVGSRVNVQGRNILCAGCNAELGRTHRTRPDLYTFNHIVTTLKSGSGGSVQPFIEKTAQSISIFMAQLVLTACETQGSLKLVVRSLDRTPHVLIWLLDSYVVLATGELELLSESDGDDAGAVLNPFPAIKLLYKVFDSVTAASDPRANGEDSSVGLLEVPLGCSLQLLEVLMRSSHRLPPACRSVGQFYVAFLQFAESID